MIMRLKYIVIASLLLLTAYLPAQYLQYPFTISHYDFIKYDSSRIEYPGERDALDHFYQKFSRLVFEGKGQVNIIQIGGSHIQADIMSGELRTRFQSFEGGQNAGRGFVFPYRLAHTNSPFGYHFERSGKWTTCRNVEKKRICTLGMAGISATTSDTTASLAVCFEPENDIPYHFNALKIYHEVTPESFSIQIDSVFIDTLWTDTLGGFTQIRLKNYMDSIGISFVKTDSLQNSFTLYGINLETDEPGIIYHNLGINGASTASFLRCSLLASQLATLKPDLVILGLGINDAYGYNFSQQQYENNYKMLITEIRKANPDVSILFTSNNDSYIRHRYLNRNGIKVEESMIRLAGELNAGFWDMFEVMGGLNSIVMWQRYGLAKRDRIHFTRAGYILMGDLLFDALIRGFGDYLEQQKNNSAQAKLISKQ